MYWSGGHWPAAALSLLFIDPISGASDCCQTRSRAICLSLFASLTPPLLLTCPLTTERLNVNNYAVDKDTIEKRET